MNFTVVSLLSLLSFTSLVTSPALCLEDEAHSSPKALSRSASPTAAREELGAFLSKQKYSVAFVSLRNELPATLSDEDIVKFLLKSNGYEKYDELSLAEKEWVVNRIANGVVDIVETTSKSSSLVLPAELDLESLVATYDYFKEQGNGAPEEELIAYVAATSWSTMDRDQQEKVMAYVLKHSKTSKKFEDRLLKTVLLKFRARKSLTVQPFLDETVSDLKALMHEKEGIPVDQQRMIFAGKEMEDVKRLSEYDIRNEATVHMILRLRAPVDGETLAEPVRTFSQEERPYVALRRAHDYMARFAALLGSHYDPDLLRRNEEFSRFLVTSGIRQSVEESGIEGGLELLENFFTLQAHFSPVLNPGFTTLPQYGLDELLKCLGPTLNSLFPKSYRIPLAVKYFSLPARGEGIVRPFSLLGEHYDPALFGHAETLKLLVKADHDIIDARVEITEEILTQIMAAYVHASPILNPHFPALPEEIRLALTPGSLRTMAAFFNMKPEEAINRLKTLIELDQLEADIQARMGDRYDPSLRTETIRWYSYYEFGEPLRVRALDKVSRVYANMQRALELPLPPTDLNKQMSVLMRKLGFQIDSPLHPQPTIALAPQSAQKTTLVYLRGAKAVLKNVPMSEVDRARAMALYAELEAIMATAPTHAQDQSGGGPA
ncbi:MAG: hypothetical protein JSR85_08005 [Proteobacteria bacterium]|nr:hypothetical protein [Pseudomonadota bacterium]